MSLSFSGRRDAAGFLFCRSFAALTMPDPRDNTRDSCPPVFTADEWQRVVVSVGLSPRQAEIAGLIMQSKSDKEIAAQLAITRRTVRAHITELFRRLDAIDRVGIAARIFECYRRVI